MVQLHICHDDVIKWKQFPRNWPFVRGIHRSPVNSPHKGQWRGALMFSVICVWINDWVNNSEVGDLRRHRGHYDVIVMIIGNMPIVKFTLHSIALVLCIVVSTWDNWSYTSWLSCEAWSFSLHLMGHVGTIAAITGVDILAPYHFIEAATTQLKFQYHLRKSKNRYLILR